MTSIWVSRPGGSMRSHAKGASGVARSPISAIKADSAAWLGWHVLPEYRVVEDGRGARRGRDPGAHPVDRVGGLHPHAGLQRNLDGGVQARQPLGSGRPRYRLLSLRPVVLDRRDRSAVGRRPRARRPRRRRSPAAIRRPRPCPCGPWPPDRPRPSRRSSIAVAVPGQVQACAGGDFENSGAAGRSRWRPLQEAAQRPGRSSAAPRWRLRLVRHEGRQPIAPRDHGDRHRRPDGAARRPRPR